MANNGRSERNLTGGFTHYDDKGYKVGRSEPGFFGGYTSYDSSGHKVGRSEPGLFGGYNHYDANGKKIGHSEPGLFGSYTNYDANGKKISSSDPNLTGGYSHNSGGCYVATCVYGSYDCPEVWTLRRFRDYRLASTFLGRLFIKTYYAVSPTVVKYFGGKKWFHSFWRPKLDRLVSRLRSEGVEDKPYQDIPW